MGDFMWQRMTQALLGAAAAVVILPVLAGSSTGTVGVDIRLTVPGGGGPAPAGSCISQTLSEQNGAIVRVSCQDGVFVSISPVPGGRFLATHGGAYSYYFGPGFGASNRSGGGDFTEGSGTIASFRVYDVGQSRPDGPLDMLVSF